MSNLNFVAMLKINYLSTEMTTILTFSTVHFCPSLLFLFLFGRSSDLMLYSVYSTSGR